MMRRSLFLKGKALGPHNKLCERMDDCYDVAGGRHMTAVRQTAIDNNRQQRQSTEQGQQRQQSTAVDSDRQRRQHRQLDSSTANRQSDSGRAWWQANPARQQSTAIDSTSTAVNAVISTAARQQLDSSSTALDSIDSIDSQGSRSGTRRSSLTR